MSWNRRRRSSSNCSTEAIIHPPTTVIPSTNPLPDFTRIQEQADAIASILQHNRLPNSADAFASLPATVRSLRCLLSLYSRWLVLRKDWLACIEKLDVRVVDATRSQTRCHYTLSRGSGNEESTRQARHLTPTLIHEQDILATATACRRAADLASRLDSLFNQTNAFYNALPWWPQLKPHCPIGGRAAYSAIRACRTGKLNSTIADEHKLFGWHDVPYQGTTGVTTTTVNLKRLQDALIPLPERSTPALRLPAPSITQGQYELKRYISTIDTSKRHIRLADADSWCAKYRANVLGSLSHTNQLAVVLAAFRAIKERQRFPQENTTDHAAFGMKFLLRFKVNVAQISPPTLITGDPERITINDSPTQDYLIPACWAEDKRIVHGHLFIRNGWDDVYHQQAPHHLHAAYQLAYTLNPIYPDLPLPAFAHAQLNLSTASYFAHKRQEAEYASNQALREVSRKKEIAKFQRLLRHVPTVTLKDSYAVGNCVPGTTAFCSALRITTDTIEGHALARLWYRNKYISQDRFLTVVKAVIKRYESTLELTSLTVPPPVASSVEVTDLPVLEGEAPHVSVQEAEVSEEPASVEADNDQSDQVQPDPEAFRIQAFAQSEDQAEEAIA